MESARAVLPLLFFALLWFAALPAPVQAAVTLNTFTVESAQPPMWSLALVVGVLFALFLLVFRLRQGRAA